jgi:radical SAM-linked protein
MGFQPKGSAVPRGIRHHAEVDGRQHLREVTDFLVVAWRSLVEKRDLRAVFEKSGRAVYISHLDLMRVFQRALRRCRLPVWHTEGFNPHVYVSLPLPLRLGVGSVAELLDFSLTEDMPFESASAALNAVLPEGVKILRGADASVNLREIKSAEYAVEFHTGDSETALRLFNDFCALEHIEVLKRSKKKGVVALDVKPCLRVARADAGDGSLSVGVVLPAGYDLSVNADAFADAFTVFCGRPFDKVSIIRTKLLLSDGSEFM